MTIGSDLRYLNLQSTALQHGRRWYRFWGMNERIDGHVLGAISLSSFQEGCIWLFFAFDTPRHVRLFAMHRDRMTLLWEEASLLFRASWL